MKGSHSSSRRIDVMDGVFGAIRPNIGGEGGASGQVMDPSAQTVVSAPRFGSGGLTRMADVSLPVQELESV